MYNESLSVTFESLFMDGKKEKRIWRLRNQIGCGVCQPPGSDLLGFNRRFTPFCNAEEEKIGSANALGFSIPV